VVISPLTDWQKYPGNPVLGGSLGTCFDMSVEQFSGAAVGESRGHVPVGNP
jgi:hypothetical protein